MRSHGALFSLVYRAPRGRASSPTITCPERWLGFGFGWLAWLASAWLALVWLGFLLALRISSGLGSISVGSWLRLDSGLILVWLDLDLVWFCLDLV